MKNSEFVSRIINDLNALDKDTNYSRRWILSIGRQKAKTYISQKWADGTLYREMSLFTFIKCMKMVEINVVDCCIVEFQNCKTLMRTEHRIPELVYSRMGAVISMVSNIDNSQVFVPTTIKEYSRIGKRRFGYLKMDRYYEHDGYIYIPDTHIELINAMVLSLDRKKAMSLSSCECSEDSGSCLSYWDDDFICPDKLIEYVVAETIQELVGTRVQIPTDENPDMDSNIKSQKTQ